MADTPTDSGSNSQELAGIARLMGVIDLIRKIRQDNVAGQKDARDAQMKEQQFWVEMQRLGIQIDGNQLDHAKAALEERFRTLTANLDVARFNETQRNNLQQSVQWSYEQGAQEFRAAAEGRRDLLGAYTTAVNNLGSLQNNTTGGDRRAMEGFQQQLDATKSFLEENMAKHLSLDDRGFQGMLATFPLAKSLFSGEYGAAMQNYANAWRKAGGNAPGQEGAYTAALSSFQAANAPADTSQAQSLLLGQISRLDEEIAKINPEKAQNWQSIYQATSGLPTVAPGTAPAAPAAAPAAGTGQAPAEPPPPPDVPLEMTLGKDDGKVVKVDPRTYGGSVTTSEGVEYAVPRQDAPLAAKGAYDAFNDGERDLWAGSPLAALNNAVRAREMKIKELQAQQATAQGTGSGTSTPPASTGTQGVTSPGAGTPPATIPPGTGGGAPRVDAGQPAGLAAAGSLGLRRIVNDLLTGDEARKVQSGIQAFYNTGGPKMVDYVIDRTAQDWAAANRGVDPKELGVHLRAALQEQGLMPRRHDEGLPGMQGQGAAAAPQAPPPAAQPAYEPPDVMGAIIAGLGQQTMGAPGYLHQLGTGLYRGAKGMFG